VARSVRAKKLIREERSKKASRVRDAGPPSRIRGILEIDHGRGVIYFHASNPAVVQYFGTQTLFRISMLPTIPRRRTLDIAHMFGTDFEEEEPRQTHLRKRRHADDDEEDDENAARDDE
jgi:hypothetical protein